LPDRMVFMDVIPLPKQFVSFSVCQFRVCGTDQLNVILSEAKNLALNPPRQKTERDSSLRSE